MENDTTLNNILFELRRGVVILAVLSQLDEEQYGYSLLTHLADQGLTVDQGTLYPLLRRLESQGLLQSSWRIEEARPRRYYMLSDQGHEVRTQLAAEWDRLGEVMRKLIHS
jgi:PadR family transcriptional regulator, regulatory protein PadR